MFIFGANQTRGSFGRVCTTGMHCSIEHVEFGIRRISFVEMESAPSNSCTDGVDKEGLIEQEMFNPGGDTQTACLWSCFAQLLQDDLGNIKKHWNMHLIWGSSHDTINGTPDEFFFLPEMHSGVDGLFHPVLGDEIQSWRKNLTYEEDKSIYQLQE